MSRCWEVEPTSDRIVQDISAYPRVLEIIIDAHGCMVSYLFLRNGRKFRRADDKADCLRKPCIKQRIENNHARPCHFDCIDALNNLIASGQEKQTGFDNEIEDQIDYFYEVEDDPIDVNLAQYYDLHVDFIVAELENMLLT